MEGMWRAGQHPGQEDRETEAKRANLVLRTTGWCPPPSVPPPTHTPPLPLSLQFQILLWTTVSGTPLFSNSALVRHSAGHIPLGNSLNVLVDHNLGFVIPVLQMKKLITREGDWVGSGQQAGECQSGGRSCVC